MTDDALRDLKSLLNGTPQGTLDPVAVAERVQQVLNALSRRQAVWITVAEATRLLGVRSESTVTAWTELGMLRGRSGSDGCIQVRLDDVLARRAESEGLMAIGGDEMTSEELRSVRDGRPGTNPWEREQARSV
jgi:hypothetical protein